MLCGLKTYLFRHGLQIHGIVVRLHAEPDAALERPHPCGLGDLDALDSHASNGKVLVGRRNSVGSHLEAGLGGAKHSMKVDIRCMEGEPRACGTKPGRSARS